MSEAPNAKKHNTKVATYLVAGSLIVLGCAAFDSQTTCERQPIPFATETVRLDNQYADYRSEAAGISGEKEICRQHGKIVSERTTASPVSKKIYVGTIARSPSATYTPSTPSSQSPPATTPRGRTGAICNDGSSSKATGSGACSHHGGVAYWTY